MSADPDLVASAAAALHDHKASCWEPGCLVCVLLTAAWRRSLRNGTSDTVEDGGLIHLESSVSAGQTARRRRFSLVAHFSRIGAVVLSCRGCCG